MDEDEVLSKITKLLEQGCTMLASHHDCGAPLFRCQGEIVCPVCSFEQPLLSVSKGASADAVWSEGEGRSDPYRAQSSQMHKTSPRSGRDGDQSGRSVEGYRSDQSIGVDITSRSVEGHRSDQSVGRDRSDSQIEANLPIQDDLQLLSAKGDLRSAILLRLKELTFSLSTEQDLDKLRRILDCLEALLRTLRSLSE